MGIQGLVTYLHRTKQFQKNSYVFDNKYKKYIIVDMNNQIFPILQKSRKTMTSGQKFQIIYDYCKYLTQFTDKQIYIVLDPLSKFQHNIEEEFLEYNTKVLQNKYQVCIKDRVFTVYDNYNILKGFKSFTRIQVYKPKLGKKIEQNKRMSKEYISSLSNASNNSNNNIGNNNTNNTSNITISNKQDENFNFSIYHTPKYNYLIYYHVFKNCPNIHLCVSNVEADFKIAYIVNKLLEQQVPEEEILVVSRDSDVFMLCENIDIQVGEYILRGHNEKIKLLKYFYLQNTDYINQRNINIEEYIEEQQQFILQHSEEEFHKTMQDIRRQVIQQACEKSDQEQNLSLIMSDILYTQYKILEHFPNENPLGFNIDSIEQVKTIFEVYEQVQFNTELKNMQYKDPERIKNFQYVFNNKSLNNHLTNTEKLIKEYYTTNMTYQEFINKLSLQY